MALVASRAVQFQAEVKEALQPHLQEIAGLVTSFFGERVIASRGLGL
jgi:hypothetical protein